QLLDNRLRIDLNDQVDVNNVLSKPVTHHYLPKVRESMFVKPNHVIASGSSRNSTKESYRSNDMAHNYYLEEAKKKTQNKIINLKPSVIHTTSLQNTTNGRKPKPRSNNQTSKSLTVPKSSRGMLNGVTLVDHSRDSSSFLDSKHFVCLTCQKCVFNANHDDCITKFPKRVLAAVAAPRAVDPAGLPSSTTIDQDVPSASTSPTIQEIQSQVTHQGAEGQIHGHQNA
nr:hypothetical protein [Tanacetum cinerariifolium]